MGQWCIGNLLVWLILEKMSVEFQAFVRLVEARNGVSSGIEVTLNVDSCN